MPSAFTFHEPSITVRFANRHFTRLSRRAPQTGQEPREFPRRPVCVPVVRRDLPATVLEWPGDLGEAIRGHPVSSRRAKPGQGHPVELSVGRFHSAGDRLRADAPAGSWPDSGQQIWTQLPVLVRGPCRTPPAAAIDRLRREPRARPKPVYGWLVPGSETPGRPLVRRTMNRFGPVHGSTANPATAQSAFGSELPRGFSWLLP